VTEPSPGAAEPSPGAAEPSAEAPDSPIGSGQHDGPAALEHATPDVELVEAQLAAGRGDTDAGEDLSAEADEAEALDEEEQRSAGTQLSSRSETAPAPRSGNRLIHFLQGSWRELQRVQWPDRRQVMQATGVVIGFVIVAGVFLGVADWAAQKIVNFILK
jgi:preprotein translocase subunit SecE